jgi:hypothetical protein
VVPADTLRLETNIPPAPPPPAPSLPPGPPPDAPPATTRTSMVPDLLKVIEPEDVNVFDL